MTPCGQKCLPPSLKATKSESLRLTSDVYTCAMAPPHSKQNVKNRQWREGRHLPLAFTYLWTACVFSSSFSLPAMKQLLMEIKKLKPFFLSYSNPRQKEGTRLSNTEFLIRQTKFPPKTLAMYPLVSGQAPWGLTGGHLGPF